MKKVVAAAILILVLFVLIHAFFSYRKYNIVLITIDTLRADYVHCYNPGAAPTPALDEIAKNGVLFSNAYTLIPITMPSHTSILTSRQPFELGLFNNGDHFDHRAPLITDLLKQKNYATAAFVSLGVLNGSFGLKKGFDDYNDAFENTHGRFYRTAEEVNSVALPWIEKHQNQKFFAWIHYSDPHEPYVAPDAPPDTAIWINGKQYLNFTLAKKEKIDLKFTVQPGENRIEFQAINQSSNLPPNDLPLFRRFIDPDIRITPDNSLKLTYGDEWVYVKLRNGQEVRFFSKPNATLKIFNADSKPQQTEVRFTGGVWDDRINNVRKNYAREVQYTDRAIGELWKRLSDLGILDHTIVVVTADHGEGLKTHGLMGHVDMLWNETTRVPLLIYYPNLGHRGKRDGALVNLLDIMPTLLDLLHINNSNKMEGATLKHYVSRSPLDLLTSASVKRNWTFSSTFTPEAAHNSFSITDGKSKIVHTPGRKVQWEAYDLAHDPIEKKNLTRFDPARFAAMTTMKALLEAHEREAEAAHQKRKNPQLTPEEQQMMHALGYVGGQDAAHNQP